MATRDYSADDLDQIARAHLQATGERLALNPILASMLEERGADMALYKVNLALAIVIDFVASRSSLESAISQTDERR